MAVELEKSGILEECKVEVLGTNFLPSTEQKTEIFP
jgi:carbamoylphosphate synthase large subunit